MFTLFTVGNTALHWSIALSTWIQGPLALALRILLKVILLKLSRPDVSSYCVVRSQAREQGLATMLFCVVAVFFVCNLLALVVNILEVGSTYQMR